MKDLPVDLALRILQRKCRDADVELVLPDDPRREAVVALVALAHRVQRTGVTYEQVRDGVTLTLPGFPSGAGTLLALVPSIGPELAAIARANGRTTIYLSRAAMVGGRKLRAVGEHELGHEGTIKHGGLPWCLAYLVADEARAAGEAPCYGAGIAVEVALGADIDQVAAEAKDSLTRYGLGPDALKTAHALVDSAVESVRAGDFGGVQDEVVAELAAEGFVP